MILRAARKNIRRKLPQTIINVNQTSATFVIVLVLMGLLGFFILSFVLGWFMDISGLELPVQGVLYLMMIMLPVAFTWYLIDNPVRFSWGDFFMIVISFGIAMFVLTIVAPKILPSVFATSASVIKTSINSLLGLG